MERTIRRTMRRSRAAARRASRERLGAADSFRKACRWLPLAIGLPFALMFFCGIAFGWL